MNKGIEACHLRDRKKDLDTLFKLGIKPGDTLSAKEVVERIYSNIPTVVGICSYDTVTSTEWSGCGNATIGRFENGLKNAMNIYRTGNSGMHSNYIIQQL